ncbi:MAG: amino acid adenylation domain-containing protein [Coxiellaceae bacterium]|jgi:amino acid adenylation domain-containing protein/thioester reductase-like protein|nr:amino acid adenylation domain-containing protein [Coxiellaceae bacterium]
MITNLKDIKERRGRGKGSKKVKRAIIIGETNLCVQCVKHLIDNDWQIIFVVSDDKNVISWAKGNSIATLPGSKLDEIKERKKFYLFSIINPYLIPRFFLENKNILLALNYHDSPLPRYAGINSTTWAIINDEEKHGVTLHQIKPGIDDGDIAAQAIINIDRDETAMSLNLKCSERLVDLFKEIVAKTKIEDGSLKFSKQDLTNRSYYGLKSVPDNYGIINGVDIGIGSNSSNDENNSKNENNNDSNNDENKLNNDISNDSVDIFKYISRLSRGLTLGEGYENPVATVKVKLNDNFYIVEDFNIELVKDGNGKDDKDDKDNKDVMLRDNKDIILFNEVKDIYGNKTDLKITINDISTRYQLTPEDLQYLSGIKVLERKHKRQILKFFSDYEDTSIKVFTNVSNTSNTSDDKSYINKITIPKSKSQSQSSRAQEDHKAHKDNEDHKDQEAHEALNQTQTRILTPVYFILTRYFRDDFIASLYLDEETIPKNLRGLVDRRNLICVHKDILAKNNKLGELEDYIKKAQEESLVIPKDFGYRYNLQLLTDIAITVGEVTSIDKHKMVIKINPKAHTLEIQGSNNIRTQIDSILDTLENILSKDRKEIEDKDLRYMDILSQKQYQKLVIDFNNTDKDYPRDKTAHQLFEEQVERTPNNIAIVYEDTRLTYQELNRRANQLAHYLQTSYRIKPDDLIALCLDRSEDMIIAMLGVLKAGGAYVPIDSNYPDERIGYILDDTKTKVVLINDKNKIRLQQIIKTRTGTRDESRSDAVDGTNSKTNGKTNNKTQNDIQNNTHNNTLGILAIGNKDSQDKLAAQKDTNPITTTTSTNLIYVIYTSGTTGKPKGVMIEHRGPVSLVKNVTYIDFSSNDTFIQFSSPVFDATTLEVWAPLLNGAKLIIPENKMDLFGNIELLSETLIKNNVSILWLTKTLFDHLFTADENVFRNIKYLLVGGEALNKQLILKLMNTIHRPQKIINGYGPTENTTFSCTLNINNESFAYANSVPIGIPITNRKAYILDRDLNILSIGATGELYVAGDGIARGYLNNPELTSEKFIPNPFQTKEEKLQSKNGRLYKTGDLVRMLPDGNLEYIGRNDDQVKIRGFRVELGEIENKLLKYISQVVVMVKAKGDSKYLIAYYTADSELDQTKLHDYLVLQLPDYMIPNIFVYLQKFPLTVNGKVDRKALPEPELVSQIKYVAPKNELEEKLCKIYAQVLNLPIEYVGITNNFFDMGGDSISSIQIVSKIRQQLNLSVSIRDIFNNTTIERLANNILRKQAIHKGELVLEKETNGKFLNNIDLSSVYLANNLQQGFIYHAIRQGAADDAYSSQFIWTYSTTINKDCFEQAWLLMQRKYPSLRLRFAWGDKLIQVIDKEQKLDYRYIDLTEKYRKEQIDEQLELTNILNQDKQKYYDLHNGNLIRIYLIKMDVNRYLCVCSMHHIILDGWSLSLLLDNVHEAYSQLVRGESPIVIEEETYLVVQKYLQEHEDENHEYWGNYLKQIEEETDLKSLLKPSARGTDIKSHLQVKQEQEQYAEITGSRLAQLKEVCRINAVTVNAILQYVWHKILHIYGASNTTVVGTIVSGRNIPVDDIENSVGLFINTLPHIFTHNNELNIIEQIRNIQDSINEMNSRSNVNLSRLQTDGKRLFDSLFVYENYPPPKCTSDLSISDIQEIYKVDYPLIVIIYEKRQKIILRLKYAGELFSQETIQQLLNKFLFFIEQVLDNPYSRSLNYLDQEEYRQIILDYNRTEKIFPLDKTIHQFFEEQVLRTPNNIALVCGDKKLTYIELNNQANQLANYILRNNDIKPDEPIAIILDRNEQIIISILAVLKAGAAYVPIDPGHPGARINYILEDSQAKIVICGKNTARHVKKRTQIIEIDSIEIQDILSKEDISNPKTNVASTNLIYIIYTSGTTGNPKGVAVEHRSVVNYITYLIDYHKLNDKSIGSQCAQLGFDASVIEVYPVLLCGGTLCIIPDQDKFDPEKINEFFHKNNVNYAFLPTKLAEFFFELKNNSLTDLVVIGEKLDKFIVQPYRVINGYGPTEATVQATSFVIDKPYDNIPIGKPCNNVKCYVVDSNLNPLPIGVVGELVIGGEVLARGYNNKPQLTAEKFVANPFQTEEERERNKNARVYRTGDLVRMLPDGNIEYIGRNDFQVKIRGYRIELGEIENALANYSGIRQSVVIVNEDDKTGNKYLAAYYVADNKLNEQDIKKCLLKQLPSYMVPAVFVYLNAFPLNKNGKLDRRALPKPDFVDDSSYVAPKNTQEQLICEAFAKTLNIQKIGVNDDFFSLGGNSILAIKLVSILQTNFDTKIADIFNLRTPRKIAKNSGFGKNFLQHKLEQVKIAYQKRQDSNVVIGNNKWQDLDSYKQSIEELSKADISIKKPINDVLLTGAAGYLGCNILNQLLTLTDYKVYLLIRANSQSEAIERINKKYQFYFDQSLGDIINKRVFVFKADLEQEQLGMSSEGYHDLTTKIDSVIHTAALVKHYGEYDTFYSANVRATIGLLEFTKLTKLKDFHYISTTGVLKYAPVLNEVITSCTEDDLPIPSEIFNNVYAQTKLLGEHEVTKYQYLGLNCNIYRIGNLAFMLKNYRAQENIDDNAFYNWLKYLFTVKRSTEVINTVEISPTDLTAEAIVKIFDKEKLNNQTYHVFNPHFFDMDIVLKNKDFKILSVDQFIDYVTQHINKKEYHDLIVKFLLHQGWLDWWEEKSTIPIEILQDKTQYILKLLNFEWLKITDNGLYNYINSTGLIKER